MRYVVLTADRRRLRSDIAPHERTNFEDAVPDLRFGSFGEWLLPMLRRSYLPHPN